MTPKLCVAQQQLGLVDAVGDRRQRRPHRLCATPAAPASA